MLFIWLHSILFRSNYFLAGTPIELIKNTPSFQTSVTILWSIWGVSHMVVGAKKGVRLIWLIGASLLGAVAVKLRQMAPSLANEFSKRGVECNGVQVKVQALEIYHHSHEAAGHPLPAGAGRALTELAAGMPDSPLRAAIETFLKRTTKPE